MRVMKTLGIFRRGVTALGIMGIALFCATPATGRTVVAVLETTPTMPSQDFSFALSLQPQDVDVSGFNVRIAFDASAMSFVGVEDNTGQPGVTYINGDPTPFSVSGKPTINTAVQVAMQAAAGDLVKPQMLGRIWMRTSAAFSLPLQIHIEDANLNKSDGLTGPVPFPYVEHTYDMTAIGQPASQITEYWAY